MTDSVSPSPSAPGAAPVVAPADMFAPCPKPVSATAPEQAAAMAEGVRMRDNPAEWAFVRLSRLIEDFEKGLDKDQEIGVSLAGLPGDGVLRIEDLGYWGPDLILFLGRNAEGGPVRLIQHYSQINVALSAIRKPEDRPARRIGFQLNEMAGRDG